MPEDFVVPFDAKRWPDRLHGVKLGKQYKRLIVDGVRSSSSFQDVPDLPVEFSGFRVDSTLPVFRVFEAFPLTSAHAAGASV